MAFSTFPSENEYVWCFAKRVLPSRIGSDIAGAGISQEAKLPEALSAEFSCQPAKGDSFKECERLRYHISDLSTDWKRAVLYSRSKNSWEAVSSLNALEASAIKYGIALSSARELEWLVLYEMESEGLANISSLGKRDNYSPLTLVETLRISKESGSFSGAISENERLSSSIRAYFSKFKSFASEAHAGYLFSSNCSSLSNWSLFECSANSWALVSIACAGNFSACAFATDCEATISHNVTGLSANLPSFSGYWERNRGEEIARAVSRYNAYSEFALAADALKSGLLLEIKSLSEKAISKSNELRAREIGKIPESLARLASSGEAHAKGASGDDFSNLASVISNAETEALEFPVLKEGLPISLAITALSEKRNSLEESLSLLDAVERIANAAESIAEERISSSGNSAYQIPEDLTQGERIAWKSFLFEKSEIDFSKLRDVACSPVTRDFPEIPQFGILRHGEGLDCTGAESAERLINALDRKYSESVNEKRKSLVLLGENGFDLPEEFEMHEILYAQTGWVSAERNWGFLAYLDGLYSDILESAESLQASAEFEETLAGNVEANRPARSRVYGKVSSPLNNGSVDLALSAFPGRLPAQVAWSEGGKISAEPISSGISVSFEKASASSSISFLIERQLGTLAFSRETSSVASATSKKYSVEKTYSTRCAPEYSGEFVVATGVFLPSEGLFVKGSRHFEEDGQVFISTDCNSSEARAEISYADPIRVDVLEAPGQLSVVATNRVPFSLDPAFVIVPLPENSTEIGVNGLSAIQLQDGTLQIESGFAKGESKTFSVSFKSPLERLPLPECPFCCEGALESLSDYGYAEASYLIPEISSNYAVLSQAGKEKVDDLACSANFSGALFLARKLASEYLSANEKKNCAEISSSAVIGRRAIAAIKEGSEKIRALRKLYPSAPFPSPPETESISSELSQAEKYCSSEGLFAVEVRISNALAELEIAREGAAIWAWSELGQKAELNSSSFPKEAIFAVEESIGNFTRVSFEERNPLLFDKPSRGSNSQYIELVLSAKKLVSLSVLEEKALFAVSSAESLSPLPGELSYSYLASAKTALSEGRLLDALYAGQYSKILSESKSASKSTSKSAYLKAFAVAVSVALAGAVIFFSAKKGKKGKDKGKEDDNLFGEIR